MKQALLELQNGIINESEWPIYGIITMIIIMCEKFTVKWWFLLKKL